jgi:hypothetical protein
MRRCKFFIYWMLRTVSKVRNVFSRIFERRYKWFNDLTLHPRAEDAQLLRTFFAHLRENRAILDPAESPLVFVFPKVKFSLYRNGLRP